MAASALDPKRMAPPPADAVPREYRSGQARREVLLQLLPAHPPCFEPDQWRAYSADAAAQSVWRTGPLTFHFGEPVFNRGFNFCADCSTRHAVQMDREGRCHPDYFRKPKGAK